MRGFIEAHPDCPCPGLNPVGGTWAHVGNSLSATMTVSVWLRTGSSTRRTGLPSSMASSQRPGHVLEPGHRVRTLAFQLTGGLFLRQANSERSGVRDLPSLRYCSCGLQPQTKSIVPMNQLTGTSLAAVCTRRTWSGRIRSKLSRSGTSTADTALATVILMQPRREAQGRHESHGGHR